VNKLVDPEKSEEKLKKEPLHTEMEKGDLKAMIIAALLVFGIPILIIAAIMTLLIVLLS